MPSPDNPVFFQFGLLEIRWYGVLIVTGALVAAFVAAIEAKRRGEHREHIGNLLIWCLIFGLIGARLYHILSTPAGASRDFSYYFIEHPFETLTMFGIAIPFPTALFIWEGGLGILGGIPGGALALFLYTRRHHLDVWRWLDIVTPGLLLGLAIGRWGNFFNQELYGLPTDLPWGLTITNVNQRIPPYDDLTRYPLDTTFHPTFLYESLWSVAGFILLLWLGRRYAHLLRDGDLFSLYLIWYPLGRLWIEALRPDAWLVGSIAVAQIVSLLFIIVGVALFWQRRRHAKATAHSSRSFVPESAQR